MANLKQRNLKIEWLKSIITAFNEKYPSKPMSKDKLIAEFCLTFNSTERTAKECLKILANTGFIIMDKKEVQKRC